METESSSPLHLPSLKITGFRGFDQLTIPRLGGVTLLAGRNAAGKTTVLDAVRLFAARGRGSEIWTLLKEREELLAYRRRDRITETVPDIAALFHGRCEKGPSVITIGPGPEADDLSLTASPPEDWSSEEAELVPDPPRDMGVEALRVKYGGWGKFVPGLVGGDGPSTAPLDFLLMRRGRRDDSDWAGLHQMRSSWPGAAGQWSLGPRLERNRADRSGGLSGWSAQPCTRRRGGAGQRGGRRGNGAWFTVGTGSHRQT